MQKDQKYNLQMAALGLVHTRVWLPTSAISDVQTRAALERIDYLHRVVEEAPDGDPRLDILAKMNRATPLTPEQKATLRATTTNASKLESALDDLDAIEAAMWEAQRAGYLGRDTYAQIRAHARAAVAAMDYRRLRDLLFAEANSNGA